MRIIEDHQAISGLPKGMVLTIGNFDGVHRGHQSIIATARQLARDKQTPLAVMTFDPHPAVLLNPDRVPGILTPLKMKALLLESLSVDVLIVIKDSLKLLNLSPEDFVDQFLMENLSPSVMVEGPDFNFGYGRSGSVETLRGFGTTRNFEVVEVPFIDSVPDSESETEKCSSSSIRRLLEEGSARRASQILGRPFRLVGKTIPGRGVGTQLGYPTANIEPVGVWKMSCSAGFAVLQRSASDAPRHSSATILFCWKRICSRTMLKISATNGSAWTSCGLFAISSAMKRKTT
jgi:riboflavin kinase/FMN adenylyltransferase